MSNTNYADYLAEKQGQEAEARDSSVNNGSAPAPAEEKPAEAEQAAEKAPSDEAEGNVADTEAQTAGTPEAEVKAEDKPEKKAEDKPAAAVEEKKEEKKEEQPAEPGDRAKLSRREQALYDLTDHELLVKLVAEQRKNTKAQKRATLGAWVIALILAAACVILVPKALTTMNQLNSTLQNITETSTQLQGTLSGIDTIVTDADKVVRDNTDYVNEAVQKLNSIDFDALNDSVLALQKIVTPLAELFR